MRRPYIGITGFMNRQEVDLVRANVGSLHNRDLMVGVLVSSKTLSGKRNRYPHRYPLIEHVANIFPEGDGVLNLIHYNTDDVATLREQMQRLAQFEGVRCQGYQLNIAWPSPDILSELRYGKHKTVVLQMGSHALAEEQNKPHLVAKRLVEHYQNAIDYVLFDTSGGRGELADIDFVLQCVRNLMQYQHLFDVGICGGMDKETVHKFWHIVDTYENTGEIIERHISVDAEGKLRDEDDRLSISRASAYVCQALYMLNRKRKSLPRR